MKLIVLFLIIISATAWSQQNIAIKGSDTLGAKMVPKLKEVWLAEGNKAEFEIAAEGSSQAFTNLLAGTCDIGMSSRELRDSERERFKAKGLELVSHIAAWDMIAVVVNRDNPVRDLTTKR
ncbi:substrate-binding domain-containing protein [Akkermansiaceae bacterium]|nr:substrate-binding domain-containing protein [Akkermansiaceae bacterium]MDB4287908.1 substrate-binding domain-containing protein [bacterium]MDA7518695.1 substrate-binding domain-containing protein [Akkermansiaceae bacterium]MDA7650958.1 substrate-binding domain-containing protein [Akkermansiaceae bacterium]MDA7672502.1 substrate-binding domain-containing protein [Akkermansiaceae bacterium]